MYSFIWRKLPGNVWAKLVASLALVLGVVALLWVVVFPWAEPLLPFDDVQVGTGTETVQEPGEPPYPTTDNPHPSESPTVS